MKSPYQVERDLKQKILKPEYIFEYLHKIEGEKITHMFTGNMEVEFNVLLPLTIFVTKTKKVFIECYGIDKEELEEEDLPMIEAIRRTHVNEYALRDEILNKKIKFNGHFINEKLPFFDQVALREYETYKYKEKEKAEKQYQKELEYKRYLELKKKYEEE